MGNSNKEFLDSLNAVLTDLRSDYFQDDKNKAAKVGNGRDHTEEEGFHDPAGDDDTSEEDVRQSKASDMDGTHTSG